MGSVMACSEWQLLSVKLLGEGIRRGTGACAVAQGEQRRRELLVQRNVRWAPLFEESRGSTGAPCACCA